MSRDILISIIVPVYNTERDLNKCIDSILNQTHKHLQIILVDDGSTDNSGKICDEYSLKDSRVEVIHQNNSGPMKARKMGVNSAKGEFIGFVDSDDWIEPNMYEEMLVNILQTNADFVHTGSIRGGGGIDCRYENMVFDYPKYNLNIWSALMNGNENFYIHSGFPMKLYKRIFIADCMRDMPDNIDFCEDLINMVECLIRCNKFSLLKKAYYHTNYRLGSLSHTYDTTFMIRISNMIEQLEKILNKYEMYDILKPYVDNFFTRHMLRAIKLNDIYDVIIYWIDFTEQLLNKKIVIYGAGEVGHDYYRQLLINSSCQIVDWVDKNFKRYNYKEREVHSINNLKNLEYDLVLIAVKRQHVAEQIMNELISMGIDRDKLYWQTPIHLFDMTL